MFAQDQHGNNVIFVIRNCLLFDPFLTPLTSNNHILTCKVIDFVKNVKVINMNKSHAPAMYCVRGITVSVQNDPFDPVSPSGPSIDLSTLSGYLNGA